MCRSPMYIPLPPNSAFSKGPQDGSCVYRSCRKFPALSHMVTFSFSLILILTQSRKLRKDRNIRQARNIRQGRIFGRAKHSAGQNICQGTIFGRAQGYFRVPAVPAAKERNPSLCSRIYITVIRRSDPTAQQRIRRHNMFAAAISATVTYRLRNPAVRHPHPKEVCQCVPL